jgi:hypothetical protein
VSDGMRYRFAADFVLLAHFLFAAFAVFGGLLMGNALVYAALLAWQYRPQYRVDA